MFSLLSWLLVDTSNRRHHHACDCLACCQAKFLAYICNVQSAKEISACKPQYPVTQVQQDVPWEQTDLGTQKQYQCRDLVVQE